MENDGLSAHHCRVGWNAGTGISRAQRPRLISEMTPCQKSEIFTLPLDKCTNGTPTSTSTLEKACGNGKRPDKDKWDPKDGMACQYASINCAGSLNLP